MPQSSPNRMASMSKTHAFSMTRRLKARMRSSRSWTNRLSATMAIIRFSIPRSVHARSYKLKPRLATTKRSPLSLTVSA